MRRLIEDLRQGAARCAAASAAAVALLVLPQAAFAQGVDGRYEIVVPSGKSEVLEFPERYTDIMVANPEIADVLPLSTRSVYVVGKKLGSTAISVYGPGKRLLSAVNVAVSPDVTGLKARIHDVAGREDGVKVSAANDSIVLSGAVTSGPKANQIVADRKSVV